MDIVFLIEEYLKDKESLRDLEFDSINIIDNQIVEWNFKNIPQPSNETLQSFLNSVQIKQNKDAVLKQIVDLEAQITPRKFREAILSGDHSFIEGIDVQIVTLRNSLI